MIVRSFDTKIVHFDRRLLICLLVFLDLSANSFNEIVSIPFFQKPVLEITGNFSLRYIGISPVEAATNSRFTGNIELALCRRKARLHKSKLYHPQLLQQIISASSTF